MFKRILVVAETEGFIVKGLETKLKGIDVQPVYAALKVKDLQRYCENTDLVIIFTDDNIAGRADALVFLKDHCSETDKEVAVIGTKEEYDTLKKFIPESLIFKLYERPIDMEVLTTEMEKYLGEESSHARKKNILIVDDDVSYMSMIMDWLKDKYRVSLANSGMQAITWLAKNHADLILLDYEMPITTGPQVLEMIRSDASMADIPVMFLTGKGDKESIMKVLALKPVGYQLKSINRKQLRDNIETFFATQKAKE